MTDRLKAVGRLVRLQGEVKRLAEYRQGAAEAELQDIRATQRDLDAFVGERAVAGKLASLVVGQRRRLAAREALAAEAVEKARLALREAKGKLKTAERMKETLAVEHRRVEERVALERLIDEMAARRTDG